MERFDVCDGCLGFCGGAGCDIDCCVFRVEELGELVTNSGVRAGYDIDLFE